MKGIFTELKSNMSSLVREDTLDGKSMLVLPVVMINEGVHNGSDGPLLYRGEDLNKYKEAWNHKPVVIYHPELQGRPTTASKKEIFEKQQVGILMSTDYIDGKLKSEIWMDKDKAEKLDKRIIDALHKNQMLEVSTGLFTDDLQESGEFNGKKYKAIATNHRPDHLALLPDIKGACSIADGAGTPRVNQSHEEGYQINQYSIINGTLYKVIAKDVQIHNEDSNILTKNNKGENPMERENQINALIANGGFGEDDREFLTSLDDGQFEKIVKLNEKGEKKPEKPAPKKNEEPPVEAKVETPAPKVEKEDITKNQKPVTVEDFINGAPAEMQDVLRNSMKLHSDKKAGLVKTLMANKRCTFNEEQLNAKGVAELEGMVALANIPVDYSGQAPKINTAPKVEGPPVVNYDFSAK